MQDTIYRKGGIQEPDGQFRPTHRFFYLYPAREHQDEQLVRPEFVPLLKEAENTQQGFVVRIGSWAEVLNYQAVTSLDQINGSHIYNTEFFRKRLDYKPDVSLLAMHLKIHLLSQPIEFTETTEQAGCKSWVDIQAPLPAP